MPVSSSAAPITIANRPTDDAKYDVLSAVLSAVSVTHTSRAGLSTGWPPLVSAFVASFVPLPSAVA